MDTIKDRPTLQELNRRRTELRNRLARAWELRDTMDVIHRIEGEIKAIWDAIDAAESDEHPHPLDDGIGTDDA